MCISGREIAHLADLGGQRVLDRVCVLEVGVEIAVLLTKHAERLLALAADGDAQRVALLRGVWKKGGGEEKGGL